MLFRLGLLSAAIAIPSGVALADTVHQIRFATPAKVLVWQNGALTGEGQTVTLFSRPASLLRTPLGSGVLQSVESTTEPLATQRAIVKIASNSGFAIKAADPTAAANMDVRLLGSGPNAQFRPGKLSRATGIVFAQSGRTARHRGTPETQSIELELTWKGSIPPALTVLAVQN